MSTKIYNGFIFNKINTLEKAFAYLKKIKPDLELMADHHWLEIIIKLAINHYDFDKLNGKDTRIKNYSYWSDAYSRIITDEEENNKTRAGSFTNVDCEVALAPVKVAGKNAIVGIPIINNRYMLEQFRMLPEIEDYCYYDNTDGPTGISEKEFKARGKVWDKVFSDSYMVSQSMLLYTLVPEGMRSLDKTFIDTYHTLYLSSFEERVETAARELTILTNKGKLENPSDYFSYIKSDEYKTDFTRHETFARDTLDKVITLDKLMEENNANRTDD